MKGVQRLSLRVEHFFVQVTLVPGEGVQFSGHFQGQRVVRTTSGAESGLRLGIGDFLRLSNLSCSSEGAMFVESTNIQRIMATSTSRRQYGHT